MVALTQLLMLSFSVVGRPEWSQQKNFADNYEAAGVVSDANAGFGRNSKSDALQARSGQIPPILSFGTLQGVLGSCDCWVCLASLQPLPRPRMHKGVMIWQMSAAAKRPNTPSHFGEGKDSLFRSKVGSIGAAMLSCGKNGVCAGRCGGCRGKGGGRGGRSARRRCAMPREISADLKT